MSGDYKTVKKEAKDEFVERRSRFIGYVKPVSCEQEAIDWINRYASATVRPTQLVILFPDSLGRQLFADSLNGVERVVFGKMSA